MALWAEFGILLAITAFYFALALFIVLHIVRFWSLDGKPRRR